MGFQLNEEPVEFRREAWQFVEESIDPPRDDQEREYVIDIASMPKMCAAGLLGICLSGPFSDCHQAAAPN